VFGGVRYDAFPVGMTPWSQLYDGPTPETQILTRTHATTRNTSFQAVI